MTSFLLADDGVGNAAAVALTGDGSTALVPDFLFSNVYTIDTGRHAVTNFFPLGDISAGPERLALVELPGRCPTPPIPRLTADLSAAATEMHVDRIDAFPVVGTARVADEIVTYRSTFMGVVRELSRGVLDTTPAAHASGTLVHVIRPGDADCDTRRGAADLSTIVLKIIAAVLPGPCGEDANGDRVVSEADLVTAEHALFD